MKELSGGTHFPCLDAYRGIGMLMVLVAHASFATGSSGTSLGHYIARFELAVPMFFVLSGFLLYRPYALAALGAGPLPSTSRFWRRRALRILPAYFAALVGVVVLFGAGTLTDARSWVANLLLLQQFGLDEPFRITQAWSIGVEISFYLSLPLIARALHRSATRLAPHQRAPFLMLAMGALFAAGTLFRTMVVLTEPSWEESSLSWLPMYLDFFATGMALAVASASEQRSGRRPRPLRWASVHPGASWAIAGGIFLLVAQMDPPATPFGLNGAEYLPRQLAYAIASSAWLAPAMFGDQSRGRLRSTLASPILAYLGAISLSFYLWHLDLIHQAQRWTVPGYDQLAGLAVFTGNLWLVGALAASATLVIASILHRLVELPFLRLKDGPLRSLPEMFRSSR